MVTHGPPTRFLCCPTSRCEQWLPRSCRRAVGNPTQNRRGIRRLPSPLQRYRYRRKMSASFAASFSTQIYHAQTLRRLRSRSLSLPLKPLEPALRRPKGFAEAATFETALDWLCLNIPGIELPQKFSSGAASSTNERDWSVRIISTARENWVPTKSFIEEVKEGTSRVFVRSKGKLDEEYLDFGKSSQAEWVRQYLEKQEEEEENEHEEKEKEVDPSSYSVSITKEYHQARLGALEAKIKGDKINQKHYSQIIKKFKREFASLGISENDLESDLKGEITNLNMHEMICDRPEGQSPESQLPDDDNFEDKGAASPLIVDSSGLEEPNHAMVSLIHTVPEECIQKEEPEELELDNLFSEDSLSSGALPTQALKQQKKDKLLQSPYGHILGNIDEIWKKGDSLSIPKAVLQKFCQRLHWRAPKYNKVSTIEDKFLYSVSVLQTASGRGKSRKAGGLITFHLPNQNEAFTSTEEAQNKVAAYALYQMFPDLPFNQLLIEPYASFITERLEEDEFSAKVEDNEDNRRTEFVDSLLAAGVSQPLVFKDAKDKSDHRDRLVDPLTKDDEPNMLINRAKSTSLNGLCYHEQLESNHLKEELLNKLKNPKYMKMLESRAALPIAKLKDTFLQLLHDNDVIIVSGETGSGKTTQVPQFILDDMIKSGLGGCCNIICTQPRRIAAISVAKRVTDERCEPSPGGDGSLVGYQVRLDSARNERTKLLFCTTGILLRKLASDKDLAGTYVIVDEVHERSLLGDFLLIILKSIIKRQSSCNSCRSKLKVILMSATFDSSLFSKYFGHCPIISVEGRTHPVSTFHLEDIYEKLEYLLPSDSMASGAFFASNRGKRLGKTSVDNHRGKRSLIMSALGDESLLYEGYVNPYYFPEHYQSYSERTQQNLKNLNEDVIDFDLLEDLICHIDVTCPPGAILVFLPGVSEIEFLVDKLAASFQFGGVSSDWVLPLHSSLASIDQHKVFSSPPENIRKVIISTDIAETSITIDDVVYVVDSGKHKENRFNPQKKMSSLVEEWISQANAKQRQGRAGRVRPGICFRLYTLQRFEERMRPSQVPEMLRMPLSDLCLQIKYLSLGNIKSFLSEAIEPPGEVAISSAIELLYKVGAFEECEKLSPLGYHLAKLPVDVRIGKMMVYGAIFGCLSPILSIIAFLSHKSPFLNPKDEKHNVMSAKSTLLIDDLNGGTTADQSNKQSDHLLLVVAYNRWARILHEKGPSAAYRFCHSFFLNSSVMYTIRDMRIQFGSLLADIGLINLPKNFKGAGTSKGTLESWFADMKQPFNMHAMHSAVILSVLCAGLYPNVAATLEGTVGVPLGRNKAPSNNNSTNDCPILFDGRSEVHVHPSSMNYNINGLRYPFLVFLEKVETSKVFLRDTSIISPYSLLLFGGSISVQHQMGSIIIDNWMKLTAPAQIAVLFKQLRLTLDAVLKDFIRKPEMMSFSNNEVVKSIVHLLLEEAASHFS
ncbi:DExH-box ATP-dependent RNA helicase DExH7, chloroplastic isoform X2 [Phalaenopsis equestris]|uniref:DExH-box ATP-dependent RNA helicase DExH7, chloroplastic isoform X2 n=1 Tax=Phalaenopsis equestris TaxID=78828 RepID=UPI0009E27B07|nr:DExH-box ATP-dependent RNA helicase DExH7, chloroplastic isoform X2 [Phalaenopsis equestris]